MRQLLRYTLFTAFAVIVFASCKKKASGDAKYIPRDAVMVMSIDMGAVADTMEKGGMPLDSIFSKFSSKDSTGNAKSKGEELKNAGIDWKSNMHVFMMQYKNFTGEIQVMNVLASIDDASKFEAFVKNQKESDEVVKDGDLSYSVMSSGNVVGWNKSNVILCNYSVKQNMDSSMITAPQDMSKYRNDMISELKKYFTQDASASLAEVDAYTDLAKEKAHGFTWMNMQSLTSSGMGGMQFPQLTEMFKDSYISSTFNFERGKIVSDSKMFFSKSMQNIMKNNDQPIADLSLIERYPSQNINGFYLFAANPNVIGAILKEAQLEGLINPMISKVGFQTQDVLNALKGDVAFIMSDLGTSAATPQQMSFGRSLVNITVKDRAALDKIINAGVQQGLITRNNDYIIVNSMPGASSQGAQHIKITPTNIFISSDTALIESYIASTQTTALNAGLKERFTGKSFAGYFNFNSLNMGQSNGFMGGLMSMLSGITGQFNEAVVTMDKFDGTNMKGHSEVTLKDASANSLVVVTKMINNFAATAEQNSKKWQEQFRKQYDSTGAKTPITE
jgi:hypothetical protein